MKYPSLSDRIIVIFLASRIAFAMIEDFFSSILHLYLTLLIYENSELTSQFFNGSKFFLPLSYSTYKLHIVGYKT